MKFALSFWWLCSACVIVALAVGACQSSYAFRGTAVDKPESAPDFVLTDDRGQTFRLNSLQGKVVLIYFGYTHCPDVCPLTLGNLAQVRRALGPQASQVQVVFITTDPERDTAEVLQNYLGNFDASFIGLRGEWGEVSPVLQKYHASAIRQQGASSTSYYEIDHTAYVYAIDRKQQWRVLYPQDSKVDDITSDLRHLLQE